MGIFRAAGLLVLLSGLGAWAQDGYAARVTGGRGGRIVTATTAEELRTFAAAPEPLIITIRGVLSIGQIPVAANKTLQGEGRGTELIGNLYLGGPETRNVIIRNLTLTNPSKRKRAEGLDGITIRGARDVFVTKCTFRDCADGSLDITRGADRVTVSWCKFEYSSSKKHHRFVMLIHGSKKKKGKAGAHITLHHNWFADHCAARMPMVRNAHVHMYNNYLDAGGNDYATNARGRAEIRCDRNFYQSIRNPLVEENGGKIRSDDNIFRDCRGKRDRSDGKIFKPKYPFSMDATEDVPRIVKEGAGV